MFNFLSIVGSSILYKVLFFVFIVGCIFIVGLIFKSWFNKSGTALDDEDY